MNFRNSVYFIREAFISLARNKLLTFAAVSTVAICILILGIAILIGINASSFLNRLESDIEIVAFLDKELTESQIADIGQQLKELDGIQTVDFVSKEEALQMLQENLGGKEYDLEETLGDNPLPATYEIKAQDPHDVPDIAAEVEKIYGIYKVNYGQVRVEKLFNVTKWIRIISCIFMILLVMGAVFLIATTIRLAIFARRKEIYLMKLIGATDWFVRWPFVIEGVLLGFGGALLAVMILGAGYSSLINRMAYMYFLPLVTSSDVLMEIYASLLAAGAVLGILGTFISLNRFLDV